MTIHMYDDKQPLTFDTSVAGSALVLILEHGPTPVTLASGSTLVDSFKWDTSVTAVSLQVKDAGSNTMHVYRDSETTAWTRSGGVSEASVTMPGEGSDIALTMRIEAKDGTGAIVARRSQVVIIKHKPNP